MAERIKAGLSDDELEALRFVAKLVEKPRKRKPESNTLAGWTDIICGKPEPAISVMLDSGAYSAWFHGAPIELDAYIDYIKRHRRLFNSIVALDMIPGENRKVAKTQAAIEMAARVSHDNFTKMRKAGIEAIPVFHQGEDFKWLERMIDEGVGYIGISPAPRASQEIILRWLDQCFTRITDKDGLPLVKTHGFGATSFGICKRYPWFTIDSTTWALAAGYGTIILPPFSDGKTPNYNRPPLRFSITDRDTAGSRPLLKLGPVERKVIDAHLQTMGVDLSDIRTDHRERARVNVLYYLGLEASLVNEPFRIQATMPAGFKRRARTSLTFDWRPAVIFADQMNRTTYATVLNEVGANSRLISYYECRRHADDISPVENYVTNGSKALSDKKSKPWSTSYVIQRSKALLKRLREEDPDA